MIEPAIRAEGNIRIVETVKKGDRIAISLWGKGKTILKIDKDRLGLRGNRFQVKDIVTGEVLLPDGKTYWEGNDLSKGIEIEVKEENRPYVVAVGKEEDLVAFKGIVSPAVFRGMKKYEEVEHPEVPTDEELGIIKKKKPGEIKVGIYEKGYVAKLFLEILKEEKDIKPVLLPEIKPGLLKLCDVVIIMTSPQGIDENKAKIIRDYVINGGGVFLRHDAVGYRKCVPVFPEIGEGIGNPLSKECRVVASHPVTKGLKIGEVFEHSYADHIQIEPGPKGKVLVREEDYYQKAAVVVVGEVGKGKVVLNGMCTGLKSPRGSYQPEEKTRPVGAEWKIFINSLRWLGNKEK